VERRQDGSEVVLIAIENGGHTWPGMEPIVKMLGPSTKDISANDLMWEFFQRHPRAGGAARLRIPTAVAC
jgi:polyhydroxybutyrate depolymerase